MADDPPGATPEADPRRARGLTYPDAPAEVIERWNARRGPVFYGKGESLPPLSTDLRALALQTVPDHENPSPGKVSHYRRKLGQLRKELAGKSELAVLNADLIVHLRRETFPEHAPALFLRVWAEESATLLQDLPTRWLISSVITFGEFGATEPQRRIGLALNLLFSLMKLYEFERMFSGLGPDEPFRRKRKKGAVMPLGMQDFGMTNGGLDYNLLAPIWQDALVEPTVGPLACTLLDRLNADPSNLFRRLQLMREGRRAFHARAEERARRAEGMADPEAE